MGLLDVHLAPVEEHLVDAAITSQSGPVGIAFADGHAVANAGLLLAAALAEHLRLQKLFRARQGALMGGLVPYCFRYALRSGVQRAALVVEDKRAEA